MTFLAAVGLVLSLYLAAYQLRWLGWLWEPFFKGDADWILRGSPLVRGLGFPDAGLGVAGYGLELALAWWGVDGRRPRWATLALVVVVTGMALASLFLVSLQVIYGAGCTLCLGSALVSFAIAALTSVEVVRGPIRMDPGEDRRETGGRVLHAEGRFRG